MGFNYLNIKNEYRSKRENVSEKFYIPVLKEARTYNRAVGFFSSTSLISIAEGLIPFANNNGNIRIIASPKLNDEDIEAIKLGYKKREEVILDSLVKELIIYNNIKEINRLDLLANLIASKRLDFRIALINDKNGIGLYHEKMGYFTDENDNIIAFSGSMNETKTGLMINYESIDVYCSWKNENDKIRAISKVKSFNDMWENLDPAIEIYDFPKLNDLILKKYKLSSNIAHYSEEDINNDHESEHFDTSNVRYVPKIPDGVDLYDYQIKAIDSWQENNFKGIFDMATGTGKTYTGLGALARLSYHLNHNLFVIIVCPFQHLVEQWVDDIVKFNMKPIIGYSKSKQRHWKLDLENAIRDQKAGVKGAEFVSFVTTNATFSSIFVQIQLSKIRGDVLLIVDEAHNFGAANLRELLNLKFKYRLALSATLDRKGDPEGTEVLYNYFDKKCIEYTLERAIAENKLTPYKYYPIVISLSKGELEQYEQLSKELCKCLINDKCNNSVKLNEHGKKIALKRSQLVAGATNKIIELKNYMEKYKNDNQILVYCGATKMLPLNMDTTDIDDCEIRQIELVTNVLGNTLNMKVARFTSEESVDERAELQSKFAEGKSIQALIAIKCLDEGVNIPSIRTAFILASTNNPKEYIQRRGRVLRLYSDKKEAIIYDFLTLPRPLKEVPSLTVEQMNRDKSLVMNELRRAFEFSRISANSVYSMRIIDDIKETYNIHDTEL